MGNMCRFVIISFMWFHTQVD